MYPKSLLLQSNSQEPTQARQYPRDIGRTLIGELLHKLDYRLQADRKTREGSHDPNRDAQFHHIKDRLKKSDRGGEPAISIDTNKELVGEFKNAWARMAAEGLAQESPRK